MDLVINEFSLDGNFNTVDDFLDSLIDVIKIEKVMNRNSLNLLKHHDFYCSQVTSNHTLLEIFNDNSYRTRPEIRRLKIIMSKLINEPPYWNDSQKHSDEDYYYCEYTDKNCNYSLAEACERDQMVLSFLHENFREPSIKIKKNSDEINLYNIFNYRKLLDVLYDKEAIDSTCYCMSWFIDSKISTEYLEEEYGFNSLEKGETDIFIASLKLFDQLSWKDISTHDGLDFKPYKARNNKNWFKGSFYSSKSIYKFRANEKLRCFGYKENEIMYILRFERDHKNSDHG